MKTNTKLQTGTSLMIASEAPSGITFFIMYCCQKLAKTDDNLGQDIQYGSLKNVSASPHGLPQQIFGKAIHHPNEFIRRQNILPVSNALPSSATISNK